MTVIAEISMIKTVLLTQDVPVASGRGPLTTQPNGDLQMQSAAANLATDSHVLNQQLTISLMATLAEVLMLRTVLMTQDALAVIGLGLLWIQHSGVLLMLNVDARLVATAALNPLLRHRHRHRLLLILVITMNTAMIAQLSRMANVATCLTATNVLGLGQRMKIGVPHLPPVGVSPLIRILSQSLTLLTMNLEMIALLYKTRIAASLTVYNARGPGPNLIQQDGMVLMPDADANISKVT